MVATPPRSYRSTSTHRSDMPDRAVPSMKSKKKELKIRLCLRWKQTKKFIEGMAGFSQIMICWHPNHYFSTTTFLGKIPDGRSHRGHAGFQQRKKPCISKARTVPKNIFFQGWTAKKRQPGADAVSKIWCKCQRFFSHFLKIILLNFTSSRYTFDNL